MKRKIIYALFFLVLLAALIGPAVCTHKPISRQQAADTSAAGATAVPGEAASAPADNGAPNGLEPVVLQPDKGLSAGKTTERKDSSSDVNGQDGAGPAPRAGGITAVIEENGCKVAIAVLGMDGEPLFGPAEVAVSGKNRWEATALGALDSTGLSYNTKGWSGFVEAVAGLCNKGQSGWMYQVNGEIPMVAADQTKIKNGDKLIWWYSSNMGDPTPDWEKLINNGKEQTTGGQ